MWQPALVLGVIRRKRQIMDFFLFFLAFFFTKYNTADTEQWLLLHLERGLDLGEFFYANWVRKATFWAVKWSSWTRQICSNHDYEFKSFYGMWLLMFLQCMFLESFLRIWTKTDRPANVKWIHAIQMCVFNEVFVRFDTFTWHKAVANEDCVF